jgi:hypothetical protein
MRISSFRVIVLEKMKKVSPSHSGLVIGEWHIFKQYGDAMAEVLPSQSGIAIVNKQKVVRAHR